MYSFATKLSSMVSESATSLKNEKKQKLVLLFLKAFLKKGNQYDNRVGAMLKWWDNTIGQELVLQKWKKNYCLSH